MQSISHPRLQLSNKVFSRITDGQDEWDVMAARLTIDGESDG